MAQRAIPVGVRKTIDEYIANLKRDHLPIERVVLFGSYAKNKQRPDSDVDICVVSPVFTDRFEAIRYLLSRKPANRKYVIEAIGMTKEDLAERTTLSHEIRDTGVDIQTA